MCEKSVLDPIPHTQHCPICVGVNPVIVAPPTTYINHTSIQHQFKTGIPQGGVLSPTLFNIYTADLPPPRAPVQVMAYADDITITSTHTSNKEIHTTIPT